MKLKKSHLFFLLAVASTASSASAATLTKAATGTDLVAGASWTGGIAPTGGDVATWASTSLGAGLTAATDVTWGSISVTGALTNIDITGAGKITTGNISMNGKALSIANDIVLSGNSIYTTSSASAGVNTFSGAISGAFGITKAGIGTLSLSGANIYNGGTTVSGGYLAFANTGAIPASGLISVTGSGSLVASGAFSTVQGWLGSTKLDTTSTGSIAITGDSSESINFTGFDSLGLSSNIAATYSGAITAGANGYRFGGDSLNSLTISSVLSGSSNVTKYGAGTTTLSGNNTYTGKTFVSSGILAFTSIKNVGGGASALGAPTTLANGTIDIGSGSTGGTLTYTGSGDTTDRVINMASTTGTETIVQNGSGLLKFTSGFTATGLGAKQIRLQGTGVGEIAGVIVDSAGGATNILKSTAGTWTLSGANTFSGGASATVGTLKLANSLALQNTAYFGGGGTVVFDESVTSKAFTFGGLTSVADISLQNNAGSPAAIALSIGNNNVNLIGTDTASGAITGLGSLIKIGTGIQALSGANNYAGNTTVNSGTLEFTRFRAFYNTATVGTVSGVNAAKLTVKSGATGAFALTGTGAFNTTDIATILGASNGIVGFLTGSNLGLDITTGTVTYSAILANPSGSTSLGLTKIGAGTLTLSGANTYTGATTVSAGTLSLATASLADTSTVSIASGATLNLTHGTTDTINKLFINGVQQANGLYKSNTGTGAGTVLTSLSGSGKLLVGTFATWIGGFDFSAFPGADLTATGDADHDGINNLIEQVFGTAPNASTTGLTQISATATTVTFQHPVNPSLATDVTYSYQWSSDLSEWKSSGQSNTGGTTVTIAAGAPVSGIVTVIGTISSGPATKLFVRLAANQTP